MAHLSDSLLEDDTRDAVGGTPAKFVIFTTQRTGSSFISRYLNNHPNLRVHGEIFLPTIQGKDSINHFLRHNHPALRLLSLNIGVLAINRLFRTGIPLSPVILQRYLKELVADSGGYYSVNNRLNVSLNDADHPGGGGGERAVGFKLMLDQLWAFPSLHGWIEDEEISLVYLFRENLLKQYVSSMAAKKRGYAHSARTSRVMVTIDVKRCLEKMELREKENEGMKRMFPRNRKLFVTYEGFFGNLEAEAGRIFEFLGADSEAVPAPTMTKQSSDQLDDVVENFEELAAAIRGTRFARYLG